MPSKVRPKLEKERTRGTSLRVVEWNGKNEFILSPFGVTQIVKQSVLLFYWRTIYRRRLSAISPLNGWTMCDGFKSKTGYWGDAAGTAPSSGSQLQMHRANAPEAEFLQLRTADVGVPEVRTDRRWNEEKLDGGILLYELPGILKQCKLNRLSPKKLPMVLNGFEAPSMTHLSTALMPPNKVYVACGLLLS